LLLIQQTQRSAEALSCVRQTGKQTMTLQVLVVDDDEDVLTVLVEMLRDAGFCVTPADNSSPCCGFVPTRQFGFRLFVSPGLQIPPKGCGGAGSKQQQPAR